MKFNQYSSSNNVGHLDVGDQEVTNKPILDIVIYLNPF